MRLEVPQHKVTLSGNTAGALQILSSGTVTLAGGNNITLSQVGNAVTISGPNVGGAQTGISGIVASDATYTSGTVTFTGSGIVTVQSGTGQRVIINASQSVQTQNMIALTLSGNTAGALALASSGTVTLAGGNNITLSQAGNAVTIVGPTAGTDTDVTSINQAGHGLAVGDVVRLSGGSYVKAQANSDTNAEVVGVVSAVADVDNFTLTTGGRITGLSGLTANVVHYLSPTVAGALTTTEPTGHGEVSKPVLIASSTTAGYVFNMRGAVVNTAPLTAFLAGISNVGNTSGNTGITGSRLVLAGTNGITLSGSTNASGGTVTISGITQSVQPGIQHLVVSNTTFSSGTVSLSGFGDITVNTAANIIRISGSQSVQTQGILSAGVSTGGNTQGNTQVSTGSRLVFVGTNNITLSQGTAAGASTISISGAPSFSAGVSNLGNSAGATGITGTNLVWVGSNNITLSQTTGANGGTVSIIGPSPGAAQYSVGVSNLGNTAGSTGVTGTRIVFVGTNVMSLSQSTDATGATISVDAPATSSLVGTSGISISTNGSTISIMQTSNGPGWLESWFPHSVAPHTFGQQGQGTLHMQPMPLPNDIRLDRILLPTVISNVTNSSNSISVSQYVGIYTRNVSTLSLITSVSTSTNFSGSGTVGSYSLYGGRRWQSVALTTTFSSGDYWIGIIMRTTTGGGAGHSVSQVLMTQNSNATFSGWSGLLGAATAASMQYMKGLGTFTATTNALPAAVPFASLTGSGTLVMMPPVYALVSGTV